MNTIDPTDLIAKVREIAAEDPGFVYSNGGESCFYERNGEPSCIVGQGLHRLGVTVEELRRFDREIGGVEYILRDEYGVSDEDRRSRWLYLVQTGQDTGYTWGNAILRADEGCPL